MPIIRALHVYALILLDNCITVKGRIRLADQLVTPIDKSNYNEEYHRYDDGHPQLFR